MSKSYAGFRLATTRGEGSLKPPSSVVVLLLTMLGGRAPRPAAGTWKQMLETFLRRLTTPPTPWSAAVSLSSEREDFPGGEKRKNID